MKISDVMKRLRHSIYSIFILLLFYTLICLPVWQKMLQTGIIDIAKRPEDVEFALNQTTSGFSDQTISGLSDQTLWGFTDRSKPNMFSAIAEIQNYTNLEEIHDITEIPDVSLSRVLLVNKRTHFYLGEQIGLKIILVNGRGEFLKNGGDILRILIQESEHGANSSGYIIDNGNGSYEGVVKALWTGKPEIRVFLACNKHQISIAFRYMMKHGVFIYLSGGFQKKRSSNTEFTKCSVLPEINGYTDICNLTSDNYNLPWYCERPRSPSLSCLDWKYIKSNGGYKPNTAFEKHLMWNYTYVELKQKIMVNVIGENRFVKPMQLQCYNYSKAITWDDISPTGYFYEDHWRTTYCTPSFGKSRENYKKCLAGRQIIFYGDSTIRQWFMQLYYYLNLKFVKGFELYKNDSHRVGSAIDNSTGLSIIYIPHELPFFGQKYSRTNFRPFSTYLNYVEKGREIIIVLHWFSHFSRFLPNTFRQHMEHAKRAIQTLLERSKADIYIKGPHGSMDKRQNLPMDYIAMYQHRILIDVFEDIKDKVTFLNEWDITIASGNIPLHPSFKIVEEMVYVFLSHACKLKIQTSGQKGISPILIHTNIDIIEIIVCTIILIIFHLCFS